jgi:hypothetical protein
MRCYAVVRKEELCLLCSLSGKATFLLIISVNAFRGGITFW